MTKGRKNKGGYALFMAVVVVSVILSIGMIVASISLKQLQLSGFSRKSQEAFYLADTGVECVLYWDLQTATLPEKVFAENSSTDRYTDTGVVFCNGVDLNANPDDPNNLAPDSSDPDEAVTSFIVGDGSDPCVEVIVSKRDDEPGTPGIQLPIHTEIESFGRTHCDGTKRGVERALRVTL